MAVPTDRTVRVPWAGIDAEPLGLCPCGKEIFADSARYAVIHELPYCQPFLKQNALEFLRYVRWMRAHAGQ
jgi:hypothetical protein